jgi:hypothetical protein
MLTGVSFMRPRHAMGALRLPESVSPVLRSMAIEWRDDLSLNNYVLRECVTMYAVRHLV